MAQAAECAAGTDANHDGIDLMLHLLPQFRRGGAGMGRRVGRVVKLIDIKRTGDFVGQPFGIILIVSRVPLAHVGAGQHHFYSQGAQMENLLAAHLVRHHQQQLIPLQGRHQRQAQAGVAGGGFNDGAAGLQAAVAFRLLDHRQRYAVFDGAAGVLILKLDEQAAGAGIKLSQFQHRGVTDHIDDGMRYCHEDLQNNSV
ncbi:hypothetical protein D3C80_1128790 [compost metagenome]